MRRAALGKLRGCSEFSRRHRCARGESDGRSFAPVKPPEAYLSRLRGMWAQSELTSANRPQTREKGQEKQESSQPDQRDKSTESVQQTVINKTTTNQGSKGVNTIQEKTGR